MASSPNFMSLRLRMAPSGKKFADSSSLVMVVDTLINKGAMKWIGIFVWDCWCCCCFVCVCFHRPGLSKKKNSMFFTKQDRWYTHDDDEVVQKSKDVFTHAPIAIFMCKTEKQIVFLMLVLNW